MAPHISPLSVTNVDKTSHNNYNGYQEGDFNV